MSDVLGGFVCGVILSLVVSTLLFLFHARVSSRDNPVSIIFPEKKQAIPQKSVEFVEAKPDDAFIEDLLRDDPSV